MTTAKLRHAPESHVDYMLMGDEKEGSTLRRATIAKVVFSTVVLKNSTGEWICENKTDHEVALTSLVDLWSKLRALNGGKQDRSDSQVTRRTGGESTLESRISSGRGLVVQNLWEGPREDKVFPATLLPHSKTLFVLVLYFTGRPRKPKLLLAARLYALPSPSASLSSHHSLLILVLGHFSSSWSALKTSPMCLFVL